MGRRRRAAWSQLLLHEQLAARAACRQQADRERDRLVGAVPGGAAGRNRPAVRRLRALEHPRLAWPRAGHTPLPDARRRRAHARAARVRVVLLRDGCAVPDPGHGGRGLAALSRRAHRLLRHRPGRAPAVQPDAHLARAARHLLGRDLVRRGRHLPRADDREARAARSGQARIPAARRVSGRGVRDADRLVPGRSRPARRRGHQLVRAPGLRVPRPRPRLADPALGRALRLGVHALARAPHAAPRRAPGQHAVALLHGGAGDPGLLRGGADRPDGPALHRQRVLALLGRAPVGRGLPRAVRP